MNSKLETVRFVFQINYVPKKTCRGIKSVRKLKAKIIGTHSLAVKMMGAP